MARITVEDCIKQINNQYELVILAKERAVQLGRGATPAVDPENDKKPVIALREIGESKITALELQESIVNKLRQVSDYQEEETENVEDDTFRQMYQGGLSKSEMEKTATRKFTSRTPRIDTRPVKVNEVIEDDTSRDSNVDIDNNVSDSENNEDNTPGLENEVTEDNLSQVVLNETTEDIPTNPDEENKEPLEEILDSDIKVSEEESFASGISEEDNNNS